MAAASLRNAQADWFARRVARLSDDRLARVMRGPQRGFWLGQVFRAMPHQLDPDAAKGVEAVVDYEIGGRRDGGQDRWRVFIEAGRCRVARSPHGSADVTLTLDAASFLRLASGSASGPQLFLLGRLEVAGDLTLAMRLPALFRVPEPPRRLT
jgi:putative sterol carrier protein